ncbi:hypothetical protein LTR62_001137 [Meristemomyces frigidus]|uniref:Uncharacterized protein n=1 Tax=Meristemomyces frigidus TaxID=1508187 RepID=A0AAN7TTX0_9PEZI|nr:hypothetical protein LTR62_001137 [Meristemomyces frigidus]
MEAVRKARKALSGGDHTDDVQELPGFTDNVAFNKDALPEDEQDSRSKTQKVKDKAKSLKHAVAHPRTHLQQKVTQQIAINEQPWLHNQETANEDLFEAHEDLDDATENVLPGLPEKQRVTKEHALRSRVQEVEETRLELQVAWHMGRYVRRVRAVRRPLAYPQREGYKRFDSQGKYEGLNWVKWVGHLALYSFQDCSMHYISPTNAVPYDRDVLTRRIERLVVASEAFQLWWMRVRHVYSWQDPWLTFKWFAVYLFLLKINYMMSFYWGYLFYSVVSNFDGKHSRGWMKKSHVRATETRERVSMMSELITRHGSDAWVEPFLDEFGPWIQLQLGDTSDFLEICANYYDWRNPYSTACSCFAYVCLFLISAIPSLDLSMRVMWLSCGLYFFLSRPIATNYPRFRHVVDPMRWVYWDSPTMTEGAFRYLRETMTAALNRPLDPQAELDPREHNDTEDSDDEAEVFFDCLSKPHAAGGDLLPKGSGITIRSFTARWSGRLGRLELTRTTARFATVGKLGRERNIAWERPLDDLLEIRKAAQAARRVPRIVTDYKEALSLVFVPLSNMSLASTEEHSNEVALEDEGAADEYLYGMTTDARDEAFNALIGLAASEAGVLWQELQPESDWQTHEH